MKRGWPGGRGGGVHGREKDIIIGVIHRQRPDVGAAK